MIDYKDLGSKIRQLRRTAEITQEELANKVGISSSFMGHIERGSRIASLETLVLICNELNTTPTYLLRASLTFKLDPDQTICVNVSQQQEVSEYLRLAQERMVSWYTE